MIRFKFSRHMVEQARDSYNRAIMLHPPGAVSFLQILPCGGRSYSIMLPGCGQTIH
ncbi:hypothetical protein [Bacteriophage Titan-X]|uniref:Uncharacterized protein n=1 Tax=Bacteriophage Titan-X TaxID=2662140 RepID=A0A5Q2UAF8_9CAUD|nr:hypothetical protein [Bacteriophage Titan-X]